MCFTVQFQFCSGSAYCLILHGLYSFGSLGQEKKKKEKKTGKDIWNVNGQCVLYCVKEEENISVYT